MRYRIKNSNDDRVDDIIYSDDPETAVEAYFASQTNLGIKEGLFAIEVPSLQDLTKSIIDDWKEEVEYYGSRCEYPYSAELQQDSWNKKEMCLKFVKTLELLLK